jgi:uncharacterized membrane protein YfcA
MELLGYFGALCIGLILGLTGGGGSILTVPILVYVMLIDPIIATAYSLFIVGTTSAFGAVQNYRKGLVDIKNGFLFAIPSFVAVYITRRFLVPLIPDTILEQPFLLTKSTFLMVFFAVIMVLAAISMLKKKKEVVETAGNIAISTLLFQTFTIGIIIGLVGAGGGFLIIPSLVLFAKLPMKKAVGTSLFIGDVQTITIDWKFLSSFTGLSIIGIFIGIYLNKYVNESQLKKGFAYFVLFMATFILVKELAM